MSAAPAQRLLGPRTAHSSELPWRQFIVLLVAHGFVAWFMKRWPLLGSCHALITFVFATYLALQGVAPARLAAIMGYMVGSEVLWRMVGAAVPWEFTKYALVLVAVAALARRWNPRPNWAPLIYFLLLIPSAFLTLGSGSFNQVRQDLSFNLSGPLCLAALMFLFSGYKFQLSDLTRCYQFLLLPIIGICSIASFTLLTTEDIVFEGRSNAAASGGFAANQVSAILGLGVFIAFLYSLSPNLAKNRRFWLLAIALLLLAQAAITFSRTGVYLAAVSSLTVMLMLSGSPKRMLAALGTAAVVAIVMMLVLWPAMDRFTDGALSRRFKETSSTGRDQILMSDLKLFASSPLLGVGVGMSKTQRSAVIGKVANAHTEFSRIVAEHGILGLIALGVLLSVVCWNAWRYRLSYPGAVIAGAIVWSLLFMVVSAMRLTGPALLLGLSCAKLVASRSRQQRPLSAAPLLFNRRPGVRPPGSIAPAGRPRRAGSNTSWSR